LPKFAFSNADTTDSPDYEWQKTGAKTKQPFYIRLAKDGPFAFAGLWEHWEGADSAAVESCTIITTDANDLLRPLHDRMPIILPEQEYDHWFDPQLDDPMKLQALLKPYPAEEMTAFPVSTFVNSPRNKSPRCIEAEDAGGTVPGRTDQSNH
jgi:putative SOS response-associated peptidase YedK